MTGGVIDLQDARHKVSSRDSIPRHTFLDFGDDEDEDDDGGVIGGLLPGHRGSMWTLGATVYF